ncbi:hypothetical protein BD779DRAFT_660015 [Infundibulicybe gibba]|nr:hypothetical protein BD779DRAFT_660015 [Infundibulicybe gibba]
MIQCATMCPPPKATRNILIVKKPGPIARIWCSTAQFLLKIFKKFLTPNFGPIAKYFAHLTLVRQWNVQIWLCIRADFLTLAEFRGLCVRRARYMRNSEIDPQSGYIIFDVYTETGLFALLRAERASDPSVAILAPQRARQESEPRVPGHNDSIHTTNGAPDSESPIVHGPLGLPITATTASCHSRSNNMNNLPVEPSPTEQGCPQPATPETKDFDFLVNDYLRLVRSIGNGKVVYELKFKESSGPGLDDLLAILGAIPAVSVQRGSHIIHHNCHFLTATMNHLINEWPLGIQLPLSPWDNLVLSIKTWLTGINPAAENHSVMEQQPSRRANHPPTSLWGESTVDIPLPSSAVASRMDELNAELEEAEEYRSSRVERIKLAMEERKRLEEEMKRLEEKRKEVKRLKEERKQLEEKMKRLEEERKRLEETKRIKEV